MGVPQIIMIILLTFSVSEHMIKHGKTEEIKYNAIAAVIAAIIEVGLLWWGGFFG